MISDPFLNTNRIFNRLEEDYNRFGTLYVAVDFDNTIYDWESHGYRFEKVIALLKDCNKYDLKLFIYSASPKERYPLIKEYCESIGIKIDAINEDLYDWQDKSKDYTNSKLFYSILLDDRAGLPTAYHALHAFLTHLELGWIKNTSLSA